MWWSIVALRGGFDFVLGLELTMVNESWLGWVDATWEGYNFIFKLQKQGGKKK